MKDNIKLAKTVQEQQDDKAYPLVRVTYLERLADVAVCEPYGIHASPPNDTIGLMFTINNDEANRMIIPLSAATRTRNLKETEFECGNFVIGSIINFDKEGNITITSNKDINITAKGGNINIVGNIHVNGSIDTTGDIVADTVSLKTHVHSGVTAGGSDTGGPVV